MAESCEQKDDDVKITEFFKELTKQLRREAWWERSRVCEEVRAHLDEIIGARLSAGCSESEAVEYALLQIGNPTDLGRKMRSELRLAAQQAAGVSVRFLLAAFVGYIVMIFLSGAFTLAFFSPHHNNIDNENSAVLLLAPIITGIGLGLIRPKEAVVCVLDVTAALYVLSEIIYFAGAIITHYHPAVHAPITSDEPWYSTIVFDLLFFALIAMVGAVPAYLTSAWRLGGLYRISSKNFRLSLRSVWN